MAYLCRASEKAHVRINDSNTTRKAAFTYDALGRRIEHVNDVLGSTTRYYYDGVNEIVETDGGGDVLRYYVHGLSYVDERLMMMDYKDTAESDDDRPYYFTLDRMYNVRFVVDRAGALVERYMYDAYGRPHIRESCGRGDMNNETTLTSTDDTRFTAAKNATIWDPRADMDDDGDIDANDQTAFDNKVTVWPPPTFGAPNVKWAFSVVGNPFMFQGRPHFALDTAADATEGKLMVNDHRARPEDVATGRWNTRDPLFYNRKSLSPSLLYHRRLVERLRQESVNLSSHTNSAKTIGLRGDVLDMANTLQLTGKYGYANRLLSGVQQPMAARQQDVNLYQLSISNPSINLDPSGMLCNEYWGNYCGPGWCSGGWVCPCSGSNAPSSTNCDYSVPPIDDVDSACRDHDKCYDDTGASYPDPLCDSILCDQLLTVGQPPGMTNFEWGVMVLAICGFLP